MTLMSQRMEGFLAGLLARHPSRCMLPLLFLVAGVQIGNATDALPISDGAYMRSADLCGQFRDGKLDSIEFSVSKGGHAYDVPEVGCVVATVKPLRADRYSVDADCLETGNPFQRSFILDVESPKTIRIDGEQLTSCELSTSDGKPAKGASLPGIQMVPSGEAPVPKAKLAKANSPGQLIGQWQVANENCRGGSGDDPKTMEACDVRDTFARQLETAKWCYGKNGQSGYQYKWHRCGKGSIHY
ncbi:hypothetical protein [Mesorhizobium sp. B2-3-5]|uniref:hypothetical protein n=1 Tax=Mesorhizobium sp. B2-3-5 TaxID=2589958 RepID=UPI00112EA033|nr:hypothetical protein [Mesorhizobium sp. B2-3-5]TPM21723.1 hypothetical protein FJ958_25450 [Mesorhizobium sp. B2-3-5]